MCVSSISTRFSTRCCGPKRIERQNVSLGVPQEVFGTFFGVVQATVGELLGADWTPAMDRAWTELIDGLQEEILA